MAPGFDPYHKWLGVPPAEQPPNCYRLLGIALFESDPDVISTAADQRMALLRTFQTGQHAAISQKLLNEVAAARLRLLTPAKKTAYDEQLASNGTGKQPGSAAAESRSSAGAASPIALGFEPSSAASARTRRRGANKAKKKTDSAPLFAAAGVVVLLLAVAAYQLSRGRSAAVENNLAPRTTPDSQHLATHDAGPAPSAAEAPPPRPARDRTPVLLPHQEAATSETDTSSAAELEVSPNEALLGTDTRDADAGSVENQMPVKQVDLLKLIDPARDSVQGRWQWRGQLLVSAEEPLARLQIPVVPPTDYRLTLKGARERGTDLVIGLIVDGRQCSFCIDGRGKTKSGLELVDGQSFDVNETTQQSGNVLGENRPYTVVCTVHGRNLTVTANDRTLLNWTGKSRRLSPSSPWAVPKKDQLFLGAWGAVHRIEQLTLEPLAVSAEPSLKSEPATDTATEMPKASANRSTGEEAARMALLDAALGIPGAPSDRQPLPDVAARDQARKQIRELMKEEAKTAKSIDARIALAEKLKAMAIETKTDPVTQLVLFEEAASTSIHAGVACTSIDELARRFAVDAFDLKTIQLERIAKESPVGSSAGVADCCLLLLSEAVDADRLDVAPRLIASAKVCAAKLKDRRLGGRIAERAKEVEQLRKPWDQFRTAANVLRRNPDDSAGNLAVGRYFSISKGSWDRGLPFLAHGTEGTLRTLAERELTETRKPADQLQLANDWWDAAADEKPSAKLAMQQHAADWYRKCLGGLTGIEKLRAEQRIAEAGKAPDTVSSTHKLFEWLGKAVADSQTAPTETLGSGSGKPFQDVCANGGLLIGFDVTTGKFGAGYRFTSITSLTPVYLTATGAVRGRACGEGEGKISIVAKDGYAVGKIAVFIDGRLQGMRLTFMRIRGRTLDPKDAYDSDYIGGQERPDLPTLGSGKPIVGIAGQWDEHVRRLALIQLK